MAEGAEGMSAGMTGRADAGDSGQMGENIAATSLVPAYNVTAGVGFGPEKLFVVRGMAVDSRTSMVTMGAGYERYTDTTTLSGADLPGWKSPTDDLLNPTEHQNVRVAVAYPFLSHHLSIGVTGRYDWRDGERTGKESSFNFGFQAAGRPLETLTLAVGFRNALLNGYADTYRSMDAGVRWDPGPFLGLEADGMVPVGTDADWNNARLGVGARVGIAEVVSLSAGWSTQSSIQDFTSGIGFYSEHAALSYGIRFHLTDPLQLWHAIDLKLMF